LPNCRYYTEQTHQDNGNAVVKILFGQPDSNGEELEDVERIEELQESQNGETADFDLDSVVSIDAAPLIGLGAADAAPSLLMQSAVRRVLQSGKTLKVTHRRTPDAVHPHKRLLLCC